MYSKTVIIGNLTKDVEVINTASGTVVGKSGIAYDDGYGDKKKTHFIDIVAFGKTAEIMSQYLSKGSKVFLEGVIALDTWTAQDGSTRSKHSLKVNELKMLGSKPEAAAPRQSRADIPVTYEKAPAPHPAEEIQEELPF